MSDPYELLTSYEPQRARQPGNGFGRGLLALARTLTRELFQTVLPAVVLALLITHFIGVKTQVWGQSMEPNLHPDQQLIVEKVSYWFHPPLRGDIVIIDVDDSELPYIKRVIGLPGETVEIRDQQVLIDGQPLNEPYLTSATVGAYGPVWVPPGYVFVLGDNRNYSRDSCAIGPVALEHIVGRAWLSVWPPDVRLFQENN